MNPEQIEKQLNKQIKLIKDLEKVYSSTKKHYRKSFFRMCKQTFPKIKRISKRLKKALV